MTKVTPKENKMQEEGTVFSPEEALANPSALKKGDIVDLRGRSPDEVVRCLELLGFFDDL